MSPPCFLNVASNFLVFTILLDDDLSNLVRMNLTSCGRCNFMKLTLEICPDVGDILAMGFLCVAESIVFRFSSQRRVPQDCFFVGGMLDDRCLRLDLGFHSVEAHVTGWRMMVCSY
ncbi:hypothetical protein DAPPUDRAFT_95525 [Daphnia pulex]|uniref:Uncharacterized protein n=1 Tax=Daphnia pulex TaxID=6669 RepID=E9FW01_DAPPU|nr:hypothetical protein DAPPUDRAFT_95525 [Daphnia pulex]|eukprot:EFX89011.1 hypothetical protein DAPPUDRAFT_95525 [Daphnia pulex]